MSTATNIPKTTITEWIYETGEVYAAAINGGWPLRMIPTSFLWGPPGVGKSEGVCQLAEKIEEETGKKVIVTDIRLNLFSPIDLHGVPVADAAKEFTVWLKPKLFDLDTSPEVINLLFFDELSSAPPQVQAAAYQITLDYQIGEHRLPDNCIMIGAGNRMIDKSVVFKMSNALANRLQHYEVAADFTSWRDWAVKNRVHPLVVGYLAFDNSKLCPEEVKAEQIPFPSPRTWVFVSNILRVMNRVTDITALYRRIAACVGTDTAYEFIAWCKHHKDLPPVEDIFHGRKAGYPATQDALYALIMSMLVYVESRGQRLKEEELVNMSIYAARFPADYQTVLYGNLENTADVCKKLMKVPLYKEWKRRT